MSDLLAVSDAEAHGRWQLRSGNPGKTEPVRQSWERAIARVTKAWGGHGTVEIDEGRLLLKGYRLPEDDPAVAVIRGAYEMVGGPPPRFVTAFGGSNLNPMIANGDRESFVLYGSGTHYLHTPKENWDPEDGLRSARITLAAFILGAQYGRVTPVE